MSNTIEIASHKGTYQVLFLDSIKSVFSEIPDGRKIFYVIDRNVLNYYSDFFNDCEKVTILIDANEDTKSLHAMTEIICQLTDKGMKRGDLLVAVGGGITQDITAFISATLYRGVDWIFIPTTLLAQADSCIGSKSSINVAGYKNLIGTFNPPERILLCTDFLNTLKKDDIYSGIGEIIKVHMIDSPESFQLVERNHSALLTNKLKLTEFIRRSLQIKKKIIEVDEFDKSVRNILNYGHSFGHAVEAATDFAIPHGIAVTMGMDMANYISYKLQMWSYEQFKSYHQLLKVNSDRFYRYEVNFDKFIKAIAHDKKNSSQHLNLILPNADGFLQKTPVVNDERFKSYCSEYLNKVRGEL